MLKTLFILHDQQPDWVRRNNCGGLDEDGWLVSTSCLWTEDIGLKTDQFCPFATMLVTEFCCGPQSVRANERSLVLFGLVLLERVDQSSWVGRLNVLVQTVGGVEGV